MEDKNIKLEDLHHSIDIKEETSLDEFQLDQDGKQLKCGETDFHSIKYLPFVKIEKLELSCEDLHHNIKEEPSFDESQLDQDGKQLEYGETPFHSNNYFPIVKIEKLELMCEDLPRSIVIKEEPLLLGFQPNGESKPKTLNLKKKSVKCSICNLRFPGMKSFKQHYLKTHTGKKLFSCEICDYKCQSQRKLTLHFVTHSDMKPYSCAICDYECLSKFDLTFHLDIHIGKICDFEGAGNRNSTVILFTCCNCEYKSERKQSVRNHLKTYTGVKLYTCDFCSYNSTYKTVFNKHLKTHCSKS